MNTKEKRRSERYELPKLDLKSTSFHWKPAYSLISRMTSIHLHRKRFLQEDLLAWGFDQMILEDCPQSTKSKQPEPPSCLACKIRTGMSSRNRLFSKKLTKNEGIAKTGWKCDEICTANLLILEMWWHTKCSDWSVHQVQSKWLQWQHVGYCVATDWLPWLKWAFNI